MRVRRIDPDKRQEVEQFVQFPFQLYQDEPRWAPPLLSSVRGELDRHRHPFYEHSKADFYVAEHNGTTLGRIAVMNNHRYNQHRQSRTAFFGYLEVVDDAEVARELFQAAFSWAAERGLTHIVGPRGLNGIEGGSVLVEGFERPAAMGVPYNPPYYDGLLRGLGFDKDTDYISGYIQRGQRLSQRIVRIAEAVKQRRGFWIKSFRSRRELRRWVPRLIRVHQKAFSRNHTYYPPSPQELERIVDTLFLIADHRLVKMVMKEQQIVGFIFSYHDLAPALRRARGRLWPLGWYYLWRERRRTRRFDSNGVGLLPAYRGLGGNAMLYNELEKTLYELDFERLEIIQVEEKNAKSLADMQTLGVQWHKRHRSYRRAL
ncbi:MAG: hypothetical protein JXA37_10945 [Chloroflexia bacterium]|nr:hypothetical protein [Chloroflexia bacterium]